MTCLSCRVLKPGTAFNREGRYIRKVCKPCRWKPAEMSPGRRGIRYA